MGSTYKALTDELRREMVDNTHYAWGKKSVWTLRLWLILFDYVEIDVVKVVFDSHVDGKIVALGVTEVEIWDNLMGGSEDATIKLEGADG